MRTKFKEAVSGNDKKILKKIRNAEINLGVWNDPLSDDAKTYLAGLPLQKLAAQGANQEGYCFRLKDISLAEADLSESVRKILSVLPEGKGKESLQEDIVNLAQAFTEATGGGPQNAHLLVFKPRNKGPGFWHTDHCKHIGLITLKGKMGSLWRPEKSLGTLSDSDRRRTFWDDVKPLKQQFIQKIDPQDFAIFKGSKQPNPLVHATPPWSMTRSYRLVLLLTN